MREPEDGAGWVLHVSRRDRVPGDLPSLPELVRALAHRGLSQAAAVPGDGDAAPALAELHGRVPLLRLAGRTPADALVLARALRRRPDPEVAVVGWPEAGPVPVLHAHDAPALRAAWLALCLTGAPARLTAVWSGGGSPREAWLWRRCDLALAASPAAGRALHAAGLEGRRIRVMSATGGREGPDPEAPNAGAAGDLLAVYGELMRAPLARARRVDWSLR